MWAWLRKVKSQMGIFRAHPVLVSGKLKYNGQPGKVLLLGKGPLIQYYITMLFEQVEACKTLKKHWFWQLHQAIKQNRYALSFSLICGSEKSTQCYVKQGQNQFFIPNWLTGEANSQTTLSSKSAKSDLSRLTRSNLWFQLCASLPMAEAFYHNMYLPYINLRHQKSVIEMKWADLDNGLKAGTVDILYVYHENKAIAGLVIDFAQGRPKLWSIGVLHGARHWLDMGAAAACYLFAGKWLALHGYDKFDFGLTHPWLLDGAFKFKSKWGNVILASGAEGFLLSSYLPKSQQDAFLTNHPFIYQKDARLTALVCTEYSEKEQTKLALSGVVNWQRGMNSAVTVNQVTTALVGTDNSDLDWHVLVKGCIGFIQQACLGRVNHRLMFYSDQRQSTLLSQAMLKAAEILAKDAHWFNFDSQLPITRIEANLLSEFHQFKPDVVVELSNQYFYPSRVWEQIRRSGCHLLALGNLTAEQFLTHFCQMNQIRLSMLEQKVAQRLRRACKVSISCPHGTELSMRMDRSLTTMLLTKLKLISWQAAHVRCSKGFLTANSKAAFLGGQVSFLGIANTVNGQFVTEDFIWPPEQANKIKGALKATIKAGEVVDISGSDELVEALNAYSTASNRFIKHFCIGLLPQANCASGIMLAERTFGAINMGFGDYPQHCDWVSKQASIWLDDKPLLLDGQFVDVTFNELIATLHH
jgi:hypothetical protein